MSSAKYRYYIIYGAQIIFTHIKILQAKWPVGRRSVCAPSFKWLGCNENNLFVRSCIQRILNENKFDYCRLLLLLWLTKKKKVFSCTWWCFAHNAHEHFNTFPPNWPNICHQIPSNSIYCIIVKALHAFPLYRHRSKLVKRLWALNA